MTDREVRVTAASETAPDGGEPAFEGAYLTPAVDVYEAAGEIMILADIPGVERDNVDIDLYGDVLTVAGKVTTSAEEGSQLLSEYELGSFCRSFRITDAIDRRRITASLNDGVLMIVLPKTVRGGTRKIPLSIG